MFWLFSCQSGPRGGEPANAEVVASFSVDEMLSDDLMEAELWKKVSAHLDQAKQAPTSMDFNGTYHFSGAEQGYYFTVELSQKNDSLFGSYCGGTDNRSDCGMPSQGAPDCEIRGLLLGNGAVLSFRSCYSGKIGLAKISPVGPHIQWETLEYPPQSGDEFSFCAAPKVQILKNESLGIAYDRPVQVPEWEARSKDFLLGPIAADSHYVFTNTPVHNQPHSGDQLATLVPGTSVKILKTAESYGIAQYGDEVFDAPVYEVAFWQAGKEQTGYLYHQDLALLSFEDDRHNRLMLGFETAEKRGVEEVSGLSWKILGDAIGFMEADGFAEQLTSETEAVFPAVEVAVKTRPDLASGPWSMIEYQIWSTGYGAFSFHTLLAWNGEQLLPVLQPGTDRRYPRELKAVMGEQGIEISYRLLPDERKGGRMHQHLRWNQDSLYFLEQEPLENLHLAFLGENDENSFSQQFGELEWQGVRRVDSQLIVEPVQIRIEEETLEPDDTGEPAILKRVAAEGEHGYDFLIHGWTPSPTYVGSFSSDALGANEAQALIFPKSDWQLVSTGWEAEHSLLQMQVFLIGTRDSQRIEQQIHADAFREMPVQLIWCGDLDGDGLPDGILDVAPKGFYTDARLYLSSLALPGQLWGLAGYFATIEPGA